jgi:hypothetical protein
MLTYLLAQASAAPFPQGPGGGGVSTTVSQGGAQTAASALAGAKASGDLATQQLSGIWDLTTKTDGLWWLMFYDAIKPILLIGFLCWAGVSIYTAQSKGRYALKKEQFLAPILVAFLLFNNGLLLSFGLQVVYLVPKNINDRILNTAIQGITGKALIQQGINKSLYNSVLSDALKACSGITDPAKLKTCQDDATAKANAAAKAANPSGSAIPNLSNPSVTDILTLPGSIALEGFRLSIQAAIIGVLTTVSYASHLIFGLLQALWGMFALFFCGMHLIPGAPNLIFYLAGFSGISIAILFNSAWQVLSALLLATASDWDPLLFPLFTGFIGPLAAAFMGFMGFNGALALVGSGLSGVARIIKVGK